MTKIEWTTPPGLDGRPMKGETWNPTVGCSPVDEDCRNCYAAREAIRLAGNPHPAIGPVYEGTAEMRGRAGERRAVFTGVVRLAPERLAAPFRWRKPRCVFVDSMSDLFHPDVPDSFVDMVWAVMALTPRNVYQILTKRPERMMSYSLRLATDPVARIDAALARMEDDYQLLDFEDASVWAGNWIDGWSNPKSVPQYVGPGNGTLRRWPLPNVWLGTSAGFQDAADERVGYLLLCPAAIRFVSCEPLLGPIDLSAVTLRNRVGPGVPVDALTGKLGNGGDLGARLDWIIPGGESGRNARPLYLDWIRSLVEQGRRSGTAVFVKQLGSRPVDLRRRLATYGVPVECPHGHDVCPECDAGEYELDLRDAKGGDPSEWLDDSLRVREYPARYLAAVGHG